jgi:predicted ribosomally synthesized peptide with SipW-like signal peptide
MFVGSTYAWFTDTATTGVNQIQSGTLDVDIVDATTGDSIDGQTLGFENVNGETDILWEPGATFALDSFKIANKGNLALKYKVAFNGFSGDTELLDVIDFTVTIAGTETDLDAFEGHLLPADATTGDPTLSDAIAITGKMKEDAGNEYQNKTLTGAAITVLATQYTYEEDMIDDQYDANATYPVLVSSGAGLVTSFNEAVAAGEPTVIELQDDIDDGDGLFVQANKNANVTIDLNGNELTVDGPAVGSTGTQNQALHLEKGNKVTIKDGTISASKADGILMLVQNYGDLTLENVTLEFDDDYALSSNCGNVVLKNVTITVPAGKTAFDVCVTNYYPAGTQITVEDGTVINGNVEFDVWGTKPAEIKSSLTINGGTFNGDFVNTTPSKLSTDEIKAMTTVNGGTFNGNTDLIN